MRWNLCCSNKEISNEPSYNASCMAIVWCYGVWESVIYYDWACKCTIKSSSKDNRTCIIKYFTIKRPTCYQTDQLYITNFTKQLKSNIYISRITSHNFVAFPKRGPTDSVTTTFEKKKSNIVVIDDHRSDCTKWRRSSNAFAIYLSSRVAIVSS